MYSIEYNAKYSRDVDTAAYEQIIINSELYAIQQLQQARIQSAQLVELGARVMNAIDFECSFSSPLLNR